MLIKHGYHCLFWCGFKLISTHPTQQGPRRGMAPLVLWIFFKTPRSELPATHIEWKLTGYILPYGYNKHACIRNERRPLSQNPSSIAGLPPHQILDNVIRTVSGVPETDPLLLGFPIKLKQMMYTRANFPYRIGTPGRPIK